MEENMNPENVNVEAPKRPTFLTVLCISLLLSEVV